MQIHRGGSGGGRNCDGHVELHYLALNRKWNVFLSHDHCADGMIGRCRTELVTRGVVCASVLPLQRAPHITKETTPNIAYFVT